MPIIKYYYQELQSYSVIQSIYNTMSKSTVYNSMNDTILDM